MSPIMSFVVGFFVVVSSSAVSLVFFMAIPFQLEIQYCSFYACSLFLLLSIFIIHNASAYCFLSLAFFSSHLLKCVSRTKKKNSYLNSNKDRNKRNHSGTVLQEKKKHDVSVCSYECTLLNSHTMLFAYILSIFFFILLLFLLRIS